LKASSSRVDEVPSVAAADANVSIRLTDVGKSYKVYDQPFNFLREVLTGRSHHREKEVLRNISLEVRHKEIVGIIGRNGAGKSTLLKIIAGTLTPSTGAVEIGGRVSAILELGTGFNPAFTGRENVVLSALMRGMSEADVLAKFDNIVAFAGLEDVIDEPFHTYSSGMQGRLAFAAATSIDADVIIIDEALSTGDARFTARSLRRIHEICQSGVTALFVSHNSYQVMQMCTRAIWLDNGIVRMDGSPLDVVRAYEYDMQEAIARDRGLMNNESVAAIVPKTAPSVAAVQPSGEKAAVETSGEVALTHNPALRQNGVSARDLTQNPEAAAMPGVANVPEAATAPEVSQGSSSGTFAPYIVPDAPDKTGIRRVNAPTMGDADAALLPVETQSKAYKFSTGEYQILEIAFLDRAGRKTDSFRLGDVLKLRVSYECLLADPPQYSCELAVAFNRTSDFEAVMYFNTSHAHSDDELKHFEMPFRRFVGRKSVIEATIDPIQLRAGEYFVSLGILPNQPEMHEFYEYLHCAFRVCILSNGFDEPAVFYPLVTWTNNTLE
jgi:ABC-type polysaccharide/polyol phosphate transport system ATPase subunit